MKIRAEIESAINQINAIHDQAFKGQDEGNIVTNLRRNNNLTISFVCDLDGKLAGHISYSPIRNINKDIIGIGLAPVAVLPSMQNQGIGSQLIKHGNQEAFEIGFNKIRGVRPTRAVAQITIDYEIVQSYNNCINHKKGRK